MSTIHGASWEAIAAFREKPAALAVYWIYCARVNRDNVAWPSLRGLAKNTGWSVSACQEARKWLVAHGALEPVVGYTRPQWRTASEKRRAELQNLDRAEYYRPTGYIEFAGRFDLLYIPGKDTAPAVEDDVLPGTTSDASEQQPGNTELDSRETELDSILAPDGAAEPVQEKPVKTPAARMNPVKDAIALAFGWDWQTMTKAAAGQVQAAASQLCKAGYTAADVPGIYGFCQKQFKTFGPMALATHAHEWFAAQTASPIPPAPSDVTPEDIARTLERMNAQEARYYD